MEKINSYEALGIPDNIKHTIFLLALTLCASPYLSGLQIGKIMIPELENKLPGLTIVGPVFLVTTLLGYARIWSVSLDKEEQESPPITEDRLDKTEVANETNKKKFKQFTKQRFNTLSISQRRLLKVMFEHGNEFLIEELLEIHEHALSRAELVYRLRDLRNEGYVEIIRGTEQSSRLSEKFLKFAKRTKLFKGNNK